MSDSKQLSSAGREQPSADRSPLRIVVTSNGERIGSLTPAEFMAAHPAPRGAFLSANVAKFNEWKERIGEPERAHVELR